MDETKFHFILHQADNCLILGQRLAEWCGHGPALEQDIALTNISLDLIGQARMLYQYAARVQEAYKTEDDLAYFRDAWEFRNVQLVEWPNGDFAQTVLRQFLMDTFNVVYYEHLKNSEDEELRAIALKSHKEALYHVRWSSNWVIRLGDGTEESEMRMRNAAEVLWPFMEEPVMPHVVSEQAWQEGYGVNLTKIAEERAQKIDEVMKEAQIAWPKDVYQQRGGRDGIHTEHLGYILAEMQYLQRSYPGNTW